MKLSKKLAVTTVAASVAMSAFAGIPLSNKGLAEKLGVSGVAYAATFPNSTVTTKVTQLRDALIATNGIDEVRALRTAISGLTDQQKEDIASPIVAKFMKGVPVEDQPAKIAILKNLFVDALGMAYDPNLTELEALRLEYTDELNEYAAAAGVSDLTVDDIVAYFLLAQEEVMDVLKSKSLLELKTLLTDQAGFDTLLEEALASMPSGGKVEDIFLYYEVTTEDVADTLSNLKAAVNNNDKFENAALALYGAYLYATTPPVIPSPGPGGVTPPPSTELPAEVGELDKKLDELKDKLANATDEEKAELIAEAVKETQAVVDKLSKLENKVTVVDGKATLELDENKTLSAIAGIGAALSALKEVGGEGIGQVKVTIDLGDVDAGEVGIGLSDKIIDQAIASGLDAVSLQVGGLTVDLPVGGTFSGVIDFSINKSEATEETTGGLQSASQVYDFNLSIGGKSTTSFDQPIVIQIPLGDTEGLDTDLLTVAKIVDGKLEFHGGRVVGNSIVESRDTFSSYVVVENKVSFNDIASVEAWAGRAIEVAAAKGAINGKAEGVFDPSVKVTRAEFAKMLVRALDLENGSAKENFADVKSADWFAPYVAAAVQQGIINGRSATKFDPNASITRAEMAVMISRALKVKGFEDVADVEDALKVFSDAAKIGDAFKAGVALAVSNGIVQGSNGKFSPNDNATRAQAAVIIYNALKA